jgi:two-component system, NarL family, sensor kinase
MLKFLRLFLVISLTSIVVTTALLTLVYRYVTIRATDNLTQASSLALAQAALLSVRPELDEYLAIASGAGSQEFAAQRLAARITQVAKEMMRNNPGPVVRVNLFNRVGVVIFSTDSDRIGQNQSDSSGFKSAINGRISNNLVYRDIFSGFDTETKAAHLAPNLMETYVPVRAGPKESIDAVFESYTDVSPLVSQNQNAAFIVMMGVGLVLLVLYGVLILVVRRALKAAESQQHPVVGPGLEAIKSQQHSISERTAALEMLAAKLLRSDEMEKKKLAFGLHEGLAQTLLTIKVRVERKLAQFAANKTHDESLASIVPLLQSAIEDVRTIATGLRPSSLDELGLLPTIDWFCREFERLHPAIVVAEVISVQEYDVPAPLKIVVYRIIESAFTNIARYENTDQIGLALQLEDGAIALAIDDTSQDSRYAATAERDTDSDLQLSFGEAQERTTLSGGSFAVARGKAGGVALRASWTL